MIADALISMRLLVEDRLPALRAKWLDKLNTSHDRLLTISNKQHTRAAGALNALHAMDPTPNKQYLNRLVDWYHKGQIRSEDSHRVYTTLKEFHGMKTRLTAEHAGPEVKNPKDIHTYPSIHHLERALQSAGPKVATPWTKTTASQRQAVLDGSTVLHDDANLTVRQVHDHHAMKVLGSGTHWCVVPDRHTFREYNDQGALYHIHDKKTGARHLLHFESGQLMDEQDVPVHSDTLAKKHPVLNNLFKGHSYSMFADPKKLDQEIIAGQHHDTRVGYEAAEQSTNPHVLHALRHSQYDGEFRYHTDHVDDDEYDGSDEHVGTTTSELVTRNKHARADTLDDVVRSPRGHLAYARVATHPNTSASTLDHIARNTSGAWGSAADGLVARHPNTSPETMEYLFDKPVVSHFTKKEVDTNLAHNPRTPTHLINKLIDSRGEDWDIGNHIAGRSDVTPSMMHRLLDKNRWPHAYATLAKNPNADADVLHRLWQTVKTGSYFDGAATEAIAQHKNTRPDTLEDIARSAARERQSQGTLMALKAVTMHPNATTRALEYTRRVPKALRHHTWIPSAAHPNALPAWREGGDS